MRHPLFWQFLATLFIVALIVRYIWRLLAAAALAAGIWWCNKALERHRARMAWLAKRNAGLAGRADRQHRWIMEGDERGFYGRYPPPPST